MEVYIAEIEWMYEGSEILGIFTSYDRAVEEGQNRRRVPGTDMIRGDQFNVTVWEVEE